MTTTNRSQDALSLVTFDGGQYSVPHQLAGQVVYVRRHGEQVVITHTGPAGVTEAARHLVTTPAALGSRTHTTYRPRPVR